MIGEERALVYRQAPTKRQRKWNHERDKGNRTDMGCFFKYFYFTSRYALISSFLSYILPVYCKKSRSWSQGPPTAERKRQRKLSGHTMLCCYFYNYFCFISLYALVSR